MSLSERLRPDVECPQWVIDEVKKLEGMVISMFWADRVPQFSQGMPTHELQDIVTAEDCNAYVRKIEDLANTILRQRERIAELENDL